MRRRTLFLFGSSVLNSWCNSRGRTRGHFFRETPDVRKGTALLEMAGLEGSFAQLMNKHSTRHVSHLNRLERAKKEAFSAAAQVSSLLVESVNGGVQESFVNEQRIEKESRALAETVQRFTKQSVQWLTVFHTFDSALKEIGDFENWIKVMEYDLESVANALGYLSSSAGGSLSK